VSTSATKDGVAKPTGANAARGGSAFSWLSK
jgi:hypothetical protein